MLNSAGEIAGALVTFHDSTARKTVEQMLAKRARREGMVANQGWPGSRSTYRTLLVIPCTNTVLTGTAQPN
jgi:hypothetical protein